MKYILVRKVFAGNEKKNTTWLYNLFDVHSSVVPAAPPSTGDQIYIKQGRNQPCLLSIVWFLQTVFMWWRFLGQQGNFKL